MDIFFTEEKLACRIEEEGTYMRDYVQNERGKVERLEFDLIKLKKEET